MIELIDQTKRTIASDAYLAALAEENAMLRERAQRAESLNVTLETTNQELACDYITAMRRAGELQVRAFALLRLVRDWRQAAHEAQGRIDDDRAEMAQVREFLDGLVHGPCGPVDLIEYEKWVSQEAARLLGRVAA